MYAGAHIFFRVNVEQVCRHPGAVTHRHGSDANEPQALVLARRSSARVRRSRRASANWHHQPNPAGLPGAALDGGGLALDLLELGAHRGGQGLSGGQRTNHDRELVDLATLVKM